MPTVIEQLELEWERLAVDRRAAARLRATCTAAGVADLGELEAYVRQAAPVAADDVLVGLVGPAAAGGQLEARVLLQLLLPGLRRLARRWWALGPRDEREAAAVAAAWERICSYRLDRRPGKVAANILMDAQKDLRRTAALQGQPAEDLAPDYPAAGSHASPAEELVELLEDAVSRGTLTAADAQMVAAFRIGDARIADIGVVHGRWDAVERAVARLLGPYLRRICEPEPAVYTVAQTAVVLQVSEDTIARLVRRGVRHRVPHVGGKVLIPRAAVDELLAGAASKVRDARSARTENVSPLRSASGP